MFDEETGLYYLRSRYYNPASCRFINSDNIIFASGEIRRSNVYAYCGNSPSVLSDANGQWFVADDFVTGPVDEFVVLCCLCVLCSLGLPAAQQTLSDLSNFLAESFSTTTVTSISIEEDITDIAKKYGNLKCKEAADAISKYLKRKKKKHNLITLSFPTALHGFVVSNKNPNLAISETGFHYGIEYNGNVYCNVYPTGLAFSDWINSFSAVDANTGLIMKPIVISQPLY